MKKNPVQDERIISQRRKIQSDAYQLLIYSLFISVLVQQFVLRAPFAQFAAEFFCLVGMGIYITIRHLTIGVDIWNSAEQSNRKILINGLTSGAISVVVLAFLAGERNIWNLILFFITFTGFYFVMHAVLGFINRKKQRQINERMDEDE